VLAQARDLFKPCSLGFLSFLTRQQYAVQVCSTSTKVAIVKSVVGLYTLPRAVSIFSIIVLDLEVWYEMISDTKMVVLWTVVQRNIRA
jgi:hypothetical protein